MEGVDYSFSHPTPAQLVAAGKHFAVRYLTGSPGKRVTKAEVDDLTAHGIALVSNYETTGGFMLGGFNAGVDAGKAAWAAHKALGGPDATSSGKPVPIYFSLDFNATLDEYKVALQFLKGAGSAIGWSHVGMYGGLFQVEFAAQDGVPWLWQTYAWSQGLLSKHANLYQYHNGVALGSGLVDLDRSITPDFGQWGVGDPDMPLDTNDHAGIQNDVRLVLGVSDKMQTAVFGQTNNDKTLSILNTKLDALTNMLSAGITSLKGEDDATQAMVAALSTGNLTAQQIVDAVETASPELAKDVADEFAQRVAS
jgi:hypothetical protein